MQRVFKNLLFICTALFFCAIVKSEDTLPKQFADGDRVCFIGDSITHGGRYHSYTRLFYLTRYPERNIKMYNCGISGDSAAGTVNRMSWDVLIHKPTVATIMLGMNDVSRGLYGKENPSEKILERRKGALKRHKDSMHKLAEMLKQANCRIIFITPSIYDQTSTMKKTNLFGVNDALVTCAGYAREMAKEFGASVVAFNKPMCEVNAKLQKGNPEATIVGGDRVHPRQAGHLVMAYLLLKSQGVSPVISDTVIDAASGKAVKTDNCELSGLTASKDAVEFTLLEKALPFPIPGGSEKALELVPFTQDLNRELLTVKGLSAGKYKLSIDGQEVGEYTQAQLAAGINLAMNKKTPQYKQAEEIAKINHKRFNTTSGLLRSFVHTETYLRRRKGLDINDLAAVEKVLEERLVKMREQKVPWVRYYEGQKKKYLKNVVNRAQYQKEVEEAVAKMASMNKPVAHKFKLAK